MQHLQATERTHIPHVYIHSTELSSALLPIFLTGRALAHAWTAQESEGQRVVELCGNQLFVDGYIIAAAPLPAAPVATPDGDVRAHAVGGATATPVPGDRGLT